MIQIQYVSKVLTYSLSFHTFQIVSVITLDLCSVQMMLESDFDKRVLKANIDFLMNASNFKVWCYALYLLHK